ncbi:MAG: sulfatase-like hydrolase/transferase [Nitrososphaeraceae archaeon]
MNNNSNICLLTTTIFFSVVLLSAQLGFTNISNNYNAFAQTATATATATTGNDPRPNILLIIADDFGYSDIGSFGSEISTPNLDNLAKEGKMLIDYHTAPTCSPARVSMNTGVDYHIGGIGTMFELIADNQRGQPGYETYISDRVVTISDLLRDAGYHTLLSGKWHLAGQAHQAGTTPYDRGFEKSFTLLGDGANHFNDREYIPGWPVIFMENDKVVDRPGNNTVYASDLYTNKMIDYVNSTYADGNPLFMYLAFQIAHTPFQAPPDNVEKYNKMYSNMGWDQVREQRFDKQKELGFWNTNMSLPERIPPNQQWDSLSEDQKAFASKVMAVHSAMIEDMDKSIGKMVQYLKDIGEYDNTVIIFTSDNGTSEPFEILQFKYASGVDLNQGKEMIKLVNNTVANLGNPTSDVNYGAWGSYYSISPLSGFKTTMYEGGTKVPLLLKEPTQMSTSNTATTATANSSDTNMIDSYVFVNDIAPTILDYAQVTHPGSSYKGKEVHPMMGKSLKPLINGTVDRVYGEDEPIAMELFNGTSVRIGDWKGLTVPALPEEWKLFNIANDPGENTDLADKHPDILQKMKTAYEKYAKEVGVIIPRGDNFENSVKNIFPPMDATTEVTINLDRNIPNITKAEIQPSVPPMI